MALLAPRFIDLAIFGTLGALWIGGCVFIFALYRWIRRYERDQAPPGPDAVVELTHDEAPPKERPLVAHSAAARSASPGALAIDAR